MEKRVAEVERECAEDVAIAKAAQEVAEVLAAQLKSSLADAEDEIARLKALLDDLRSQLAAALSDAADAHAKVAELDAALAGSRDECAATKAALDNTKERLEEVTARKDALKVGRLLIADRGRPAPAHVPSCAPACPSPRGARLPTPAHPRYRCAGQAGRAAGAA